MKSAKIYFNEINLLILATEGTGDNLLDEDVEAGFKDYIMANVYELDGYEATEVDSAQIMCEELVGDMSQEEFEERVITFFEQDKSKATIL